MKKINKLYRFLQIVVKPFYKLFFRMEVIGQENEPEEGSFLVCGNHTAASDAVVVAYAFRKHQVRLMA
jgi:1-acyl-sn-glycerol-3-phosphate acyltransferase